MGIKTRRKRRTSCKRKTRKQFGGAMTEEQCRKIFFLFKKNVNSFITNIETEEIFNYKEPIDFVKKVKLKDCIKYDDIQIQIEGFLEKLKKLLDTVENKNMKKSTINEMIDAIETAKTNGDVDLTEEDCNIIIDNFFKYITDFIDETNKSTAIDNETLKQKYIEITKKFIELKKCFKYEMKMTSIFNDLHQILLKFKDENLSNSKIEIANFLLTNFEDLLVKMNESRKMSMSIPLASGGGKGADIFLRGSKQIAFPLSASKKGFDTFLLEVNAIFDELNGIILQNNENEFNLKFYKLFDTIKELLKSDNSSHIQGEQYIKNVYSDIRTKITNIVFKPKLINFKINKNIILLMEFIIEFIGEKIETHTEEYKKLTQIIITFLIDLQKINLNLLIEPPEKENLLEYTRQVQLLNDIIYEINNKYIEGKKMNFGDFSDGIDIIIGTTLLNDTQLLKIFNDNSKKLKTVLDNKNFKGQLNDSTYKINFDFFKKIIYKFDEKINKHKEFAESFNIINRIYVDLNAIFDNEKDTNVALEKIKSIMKTYEIIDNKNKFTFFSKYIKDRYEKDRYDYVEIIDVIITYKNFCERLESIETLYGEKDKDKNINKIKKLFHIITVNYDFFSIKIKPFNNPENEKDLIEMFLKKKKKDPPPSKKKDPPPSGKTGGGSFIPSTVLSQPLPPPTPSTNLTVSPPSTNLTVYPPPPPLQEVENAFLSPPPPLQVYEKAGGGIPLTESQRKIRNLTKKLNTPNITKERKNEILMEIEKINEEIRREEYDNGISVYSVPNAQIRQNFKEIETSSNKLCEMFSSDPIIQTLLSVDVGEIYSHIYSDFVKFMEFFNNGLFKYNYLKTDEFTNSVIHSAVTDYTKIQNIILFVIGFLNSKLDVNQLLVIKGGLNMKMLVAKLANIEIELSKLSKEQSEEQQAALLNLMKTNDLDIVINVPEQMRANNDYKHCVCQVFSKILYELLFYDLIHLNAINVFAPKTVILYKMPNDISPAVSNIAAGGGSAVALSNASESVSTIYKFSLSVAHRMYPIVDIDPNFDRSPIDDANVIEFKKMPVSYVTYKEEFGSVELLFHCQSFQYFVEDKITFYNYYKSRLAEIEKQPTEIAQLRNYGNLFNKFDRYMKIFKILLRVQESYNYMMKHRKLINRSGN